MSDKPFILRTNAPYWTNLLANQAANKKLPCEVPGCLKLRHSTGTYCRSHQRLDTITGSPVGKLPTRAELVPLSKRIAALLRSNATHPAILFSERTCRTWLSDCAAGAHGLTPAPKQLKRLADGGCTGTELLVRLACVVHLNRVESARFTEVEFHRALARCAFALRPAAYRQVVSSKSNRTYPQLTQVATLKDCKAFASAVLSQLAPALLRISYALDEATSAAVKAQEEERALLSLPTSAAELAEIAGLIQA